MAMVPERLLRGFARCWWLRVCLSLRGHAGFWECMSETVRIVIRTSPKHCKWYSDLLETIPMCHRGHFTYISLDIQTPPEESMTGPPKTYRSNTVHLRNLRRLFARLGCRVDSFSLGIPKKKTTKKTMWWQLNYLIYVPPQSLGKVNPFWLKHIFLRGLVWNHQLN